MRFLPSRSWGRLALIAAGLVGAGILVFSLGTRSYSAAAVAAPRVKTAAPAAATPSTTAASAAEAMPRMAMPDMPGMAMPASSAPHAGPAWATPAYHSHAPRGPLPATLPPSQFTDPRVQAIYAMAAKIEKVLYQQPCYCRCDRELGHTSLLSCYIGTHASICQVCLMEAAFAYHETQRGRTPAQIRREIMQGAWRKINLEQVIARYAH